MKLAEIEQQLLSRLNDYQKCEILDAVIQDRVPVDRLSR